MLDKLAFSNTTSSTDITSSAAKFSERVAGYREYKRSIELVQIR